MADYYDRVKQLTELASWDDSPAYEVDMGGIYWDPAIGKYVFISASGCSCWDGDYDESQYDKLADLFVKEMVRDSTYNPSSSTFERLVEEATMKALELGLIK